MIGVAKHLRRKIAAGAAGITRVTVLANPGDNVGATGPSLTFTAAALSAVQINDLVVATFFYAASTPADTVIQTGGQTWSAGHTTTGTGRCSTLFWCQFNGTWTGDVEIGRAVGTSAAQLILQAYRPGSVGTTWAEAMTFATVGVAAPGGPPYDCTGAAITTATGNRGVFLQFLNTADNNSWGGNTLTPGDWTLQVGGAQFRGTSLLSVTFADLIRDTTMTAATSGFTIDQSAEGPDAYARQRMAWNLS